MSADPLLTLDHSSPIVTLQGHLLSEQAGGKALTAPGQRILDVQPKAIHERTPVILGSAAEVDHVAAQLG